MGYIREHIQDINRAPEAFKLFVKHLNPQREAKIVRLNLYLVFEYSHDRS